MVSLTQLLANGSRRLRSARVSADGEIFATHRAIYAKARVLVRVFYAVLVLRYLPDMLNHLNHLALFDKADPLWPVAWIDWVGKRTGAVMVIAFAAFGMLAAAAFPSRRICRLAACGGVFLWTALGSSFGKINHSEHVIIYVSFIFLFLADHDGRVRPPSISQRQLYLFWFATAQASLLATYTLSGTRKIMEIVRAGLDGSTSYVSFDGLASIIAADIHSKHSKPILGPFMVDHFYLSWAMGLAVLCIQFFAFTVMFRPQLHRLWGFCIIGFHAGTVLMMDVHFTSHILAAGLLLVCSPFSPENLTLTDVWASLPGVHEFAGRWANDGVGRQLGTLPELDPGQFVLVGVWLSKVTLRGEENSRGAFLCRLIRPPRRYPHSLAGRAYQRLFHSKCA